MATEQFERFGAGLALALVSAFSFSLSGPLASGLQAAGWSALALVLARMSIGIPVLLGPGLRALRGRWKLLRDNRRFLLGYGVLGVSLPQIAFFNSVQYLQVAQALLIQYLAPVALVVLLWVRLGERPGPRTIIGSVVAMIGLMLVLQVFSADLSLDWRGLAWACAALVGNASYFLFASDGSNTLPQATVALFGILVGLATMALVALFGVLPVRFTTGDVVFAGTEMPFWVPLLALGVVCAAISYLSGVAAARILGTRLASFIGLSEALMAALLATLLLGQVLSVLQVLGAALVLAGVVLVKLGESRIGVPKLPARR